MKNDLAILFCSFHRNNDIWPITKYYFSKYWSDCPYDVFLGANGEPKENFCPQGWKYINLGPDKSWGSSLQDYLSQIPAKYILLLVDDTALVTYPQEKLIKHVLEFMETHASVMCRLGPRPGPDKMVDEIIGRIDVEAEVPYITSWTNVIWQKDFLLELLKYQFNPWEFEIKAGKTPLAKEHANDFYASKTHIIKFFHFVEKGKFDRRIRKMLKRDNVAFDLTLRSFLNKQEFVRLRLGHFRGFLQRVIPNQYKNSLRKTLGLKEL